MILMSCFFSHRALSIGGASTSSSSTSSPEHQRRGPSGTKVPALHPALKHSNSIRKDPSCHRNQRSMSLGGSAHETLLSSIQQSHQLPTQTIELSRGENGDHVILLVENTRFIVNPTVLMAKHDTMLGRMFAVRGRASAGEGSDLVRPNERNEYEVADGLSANCFQAILDFYHHGYIRVPPTVSVAELREACDYLMIPFNDRTIKCQDLRGLLHELSNEGARSQFTTFLEDIILPQLVVSAEHGDRECHIVVLLDEDVV
uniref:BTB domain-containing protein n=1 Tax=Acrobeloides nanus TaxID=290746 RepID=A0A914DVU9_9BILA